MPQCIGRDYSSVRRERSVKEEEENEGSKEEGDKAPATKRRKVPKSQFNREVR